ncbi:Protein N-acetyltransferase, RimJ/RimL family [Quadrisphaera granulorum]|uniref:RimJ/RimL family protein N-acetyltransferase n=1 Tax=Quadrisphaera granulorum TaxID=317664 RepID=A0A316A9C7_9ACTN|nr:GNAT family protein [Quadrisphaera granulorum]PWJ53600.1 RimJ/RimL family protein N-acetyltransferase [Quadrisphaera granulorum]SZE96644.1 Protein N-acetyltransferase, RimJ/RimL family [Quadrisphaera granulorum]
MSHELRTPEGLLLRAWQDDDAAAVLEAFSSPDMARQTAEPITDLNAAIGWIWRASAGRDTDAWFSWAVSDPDGAVLGNVTVSGIDRRHEQAWVSYWTLPRARGRGVAAAATRAAARWAFSEGGLHRLELGHRTNNPTSCRVALAAGFAVEGVEREKLLYDGVRFDVGRHARLATDPAPSA